MSFGESCARIEPSRYSTSEWTADCGRITTSMRDGAPGPGPPEAPAGAGVGLRQRRDVDRAGAAPAASHARELSADAVRILLLLHRDDGRPVARDGRQGDLEVPARRHRDDAEALG